ncbi:MAG: hypothetical protein WAU49_20955 [Steroidobacteraceae bacterium]
MKTVLQSIFKLLPATALASICAVGAAYGQALQPNQTYGFSGGKIVLFTYEENFDCVDQPTNDLNYNNVPAQSDSSEFQTPICQAGIQPTIDPTGAKASTTAVLYVLVPMFSVNDDQNPNDAIACPAGVRLSTICGAVLGKTLIKLFGAVPEGFKTKPMVYTDCPNPGAAPGTCTMHSSTIDLGKVLVALGKLPAPAGNVFLPSPNHSHVITYSGATGKPIWWEVEPVLVLNLADWPTKDGSSGITSVAGLQAAEKTGDAVEVPSNFYLFFSSQPMSNSMMDMR